MKTLLQNLLRTAAGACLASLVLTAPAMAQKTQLNVYTAIEIDQMKVYKEAFEKANPDIEIVWSRDSTGVITAKFLAEKSNPKADVVLGLAVTSLLVLDQDGMLAPYAPKGIEAISPQYKDARNPPHWVGMDVWGAAVCFNTAEAQKQGLPRPETWKDLTKPIYKGKIVMPHPASSGTGYLDVAGWLQTLGEQDGWKYMDALHENIAEYQHSGSKPCSSAGSGEFPIGISFEYRANMIKAKGAPIDLIFPKEGLGWDMEASGIVKTTQKMGAAKKLMDWVVSRPAMELFAKNYAVVALPDVAKPLPHIPADYEKRLVKSDLAWAAKNRERILAEWSRRYEGKAAAK
ncbi:MAG: putative 2-aminoethylphosphonate ABC transporter substrate-binding protein [Collimonas pratensis]|uniref:putative 2-aminoethylphosphonate ABC transporter substrate-binding protein n=1 Tax=Collimonas pratensis TaxID=279113 RepID=UPI003C76E141